MLAAVLLAAGAATRYGADKLMVTLADGRPILAAAIDALSPHVGCVVGVVGPQHRARAELLRARGCRVATCQQAAAGMGHSLAAGIAALPVCTDYLVALGDMPWLQAETVAQVVQYSRDNASSVIIAPRFQGRRGHPILFRGTLRAQLLALEGDQGARAMMERHAAQIRYCEVEDAGILRDVDRPEDLIGLSI